MKKSVKYLSFGALLLLLVGIGFYRYAVTRPIISYPSYAYIYTDKEAINVAEHIVVGKVLKKNDSYGPIPFTDFEIEVEKTLKGNLNKNFTFAQEGGYDAELKRNVQFGTYESLKPDYRYVLFIRKHPDEPNKFISVNNGFSVYKINGDDALNMLDSSRSQKLTNLEQMIKNYLE